MTLDPKEKRWAAWVALAIMVLIGLFFWRRHYLASTLNGTVSPTPSPSSEPIFFSNTPGIPDSNQVYNGQPNSVNTLATLSINENLPGYLTTGYMPIYGLVGFGVGPGVY